MTDARGELRVALTRREGRSAALWRGPGRDDWQPLFEAATLHAPFGISAVDNTGQLFVTQAKGKAGETVLSRYDFERRAPEAQPLVVTPGFNFQGAVLNEGEGAALGVRVVKVERGAGGKVLHLTPAADPRAGGHAGKATVGQPIEVDEILVAVGRAPNVEGLGLEVAGVSYDAVAGVMVDDRLRTTNPSIYAAGDICTPLKFTHHSDFHARLVIQNALFFGRAKASAPFTRRFRVSGIFYSGFGEYDGRLMYASLRETQKLLGGNDVVLGVELKVRDVDRAKEIAERLEKALGGPPYQVQDWYELNHNLFTALTLSFFFRSAISATTGEAISAPDRFAGAALGAVRIVLVAVLIVLIFDRIIPANREPAFLNNSKLRPILSVAGKSGVRQLPPDMIAYIDNLKRQRGI